ncbi:hypothetical protein IUK39_03720 [Priestia aryabhattai]|uniref:hypothetical protein n=1 Tax=Priestia aryabhattai TaxID=412384 RepID=UPI001C0D22CC|nr:hypothetical protein [Priestia aryabhattai]MBU3569286.1 hypothetical protein [Priestia aryabhattai]
MAYTKTVWNDRIKNSAGDVIQEGTPVSAGNMNKIEKGIEDAHKQMEQAAKETVSLPYGLSVLNSPNGSPLDIEIQGRTLASLGNSDLEGGKYYVLASADGRTAIVVDGTTYKGIAKFAGKNTRPTVIRTANFEGKVAGSTVENPHIYKATSTSVLTAPSAFGSSDVAQTNYDKANSLNATVTSVGASNAASMPQALFSFNLIEEVERKIGKIPGSTVADKVTWLKSNLNKITCNWHGYGSSVSGNKATFSAWAGSWLWNLTQTTGSVAMKKIAIGASDTISNYIQSDGFVHFLAYADASDGVTASTINTDYVELDIELKANADFYAPRVPLYEVPQESYDKILVEWDAAAVATRYPMVEGLKSLQNPVVTIEGENLLPPFTEWSLHPNTKIISPYELEMNAVANANTNNIQVDVLPNTQYTIFLDGNCKIGIYNTDGLQVISGYSGSIPRTFNTGNNTKIKVFISNDLQGSGLFTAKNPILTLGSSVRPFKPRNPSYLYADTILRGLNSINDVLYQDDGRWKVLKKWEESILDSTLTYGKNADAPGLKEFFISGLLPNPSNQIKSMISLKFNGKNTPYNALVNVDTYSVSSSTDRFYLRVSNGDTGFVDAYNPSTDEIKAYFNGWKVKTVDGSNKPTAWVSVIDGKDAPTQTLDYVKANKAPDYTGYRLLYQLPTPKVVDITDKVEGSLSVSGQTQVSLDSGVIARGKVTPYYYNGDNSYKINLAGLETTAPESILKYKADKILKIYEDGSDFKNYTIVKGGAYGNERATIQPVDYKANATYSVTYLALEKEKFATNPVNVKASYNTSIRSTVDQMNEQLADVKSMASIHERYLYKLLLAAKANGWSV